jgi:hypothetical protein
MFRVLLNLLLRAHTAYFLWEVLTHPDDPRFAGKAIPIRNLVIVSALSLIFPFLHLARRRWRSYPWGTDCLYLSIFWLDMLGNSRNLYDTHYYFDLVPHFHGSGALAAALKTAFDLPTLSAVGLANMVHVALEGQEYYTDVVFSTHNVRGVSDTVNDLLAGLCGTISYGLASAWLQRRSRKG